MSCLPESHHGNHQNSQAIRRNYALYRNRAHSGRRRDSASREPHICAPFGSPELVQAPRSHA
jgi:hypothetical protein